MTAHDTNYMKVTELTEENKAEGFLSAINTLLSDMGRIKSLKHPMSPSSKYFKSFISIK